MTAAMASLLGRFRRPNAGMDPLLLDFLRASQEAVTRQQEMAGLLAATLGVPVSGLYYFWMQHDCEQEGGIPETEWTYFFHGLECDVYSRLDGRFVRLDFGPHGRVDTFSGWGVMQFVLASKAPRQEFARLRKHLADQPPPYHSLSGSFARMTVLEEGMERMGFVEPADAELCRLVREHTRQTENGQLIDLPEGTSEQTRLDILVCGNWVLTEKARQVLAERA